MSKIKDLYAIENQIDDLMPVDEARIDVKKVADDVFQTAKGKDTKEEIENRANYDFGEDDEGHLEAYIENYLDICKDVAADRLDDLIQAEHYDLTDTEYYRAITIAADLLADYYADFESELCDEALKEQKHNETFMLDDLADRKGYC